MKKKIIGITGSLASGKTAVSKLLSAKGAFMIDADKISHEILRNNAYIQNAIIDFFGSSILTNGRIDRKKLADEVFPDERKMRYLCDVLHPEIKKTYKTGDTRFGKRDCRYRRSASNRVGIS